MKEHRIAVWDARCERQIGNMLLSCLDLTPPPVGSKIAADLRRWGENLVVHGERELAKLGVRHLEVAA